MSRVESLPSIGLPCLYYSALTEFCRSSSLREYCGDHHLILVRLQQTGFDTEGDGFTLSGLEFHEGSEVKCKDFSGPVMN